MKITSLPAYFQEYDGSMVYSIGDRVYGTLAVKDNVVSYRFNNGDRPYEDEREFDSESKAVKFVAKFATEMRRCDKRQSVPTSSTFRDFEI